VVVVVVVVTQHLNLSLFVPSPSVAQQAELFAQQAPSTFSFEMLSFDFLVSVFILLFLFGGKFAI
jgi:hypothetical protein